MDRKSLTKMYDGIYGMEAQLHTPSSHQTVGEVQGLAEEC